ncbi:MAG TPA: PKD domain-containing protein, partial [Thermoanaerobaculia bacterium]|nr:PKD domain-containing protein [Thermoanaerobaculia bacterium]
DLKWTPAAGGGLTQVYRAVGLNPNPADFRYIGTTTGGAFTDRQAQGGYAYSYIVRGADDCGEGPASNAAAITANGLCDIAPAFSGLATARADATNCRILLSWPAGHSNCPLGNSIRYNIYRSTSPGTPPTGTPYATTTDTSFSDTNVASGVTYYYTVRAEDTTTASAGPSHGNEETNDIQLFATAFGGPGATGTFRDGAGDGGAFLSPDVPWQLSSSESHSGGHSYHNGEDHDTYQRDTCASIVTPAITLDANAELSYFARFNLEFLWDGVIVEISDDNGATWKDLPPNGGYPGTLAETQGTSGTEAPVNACGDPKTRAAFTGPPANTALTPWTEYRSPLAAYAGKSVKIRWRFTSDPGSEFEGFYLDDISIVNAKMPGACTLIVTTPGAAFDLVPGLPARGLPVQFRDKSTNVPTTWLWTFGDGTSSTQQNPTHTYTAAGTYVVALTVTNAAGQSSTTMTIHVSEPEKANKRRSVGGHG